MPLNSSLLVSAASAAAGQKAASPTGMAAGAKAGTDKIWTKQTDGNRFIIT